MTARTPYRGHGPGGEAAEPTGSRAAPICLVLYAAAYQGASPDYESEQSAVDFAGDLGGSKPSATVDGRASTQRKARPEFEAGQLPGDQALVAELIGHHGDMGDDNFDW